MADFGDKMFERLANERCPGSHELPGGVVAKGKGTCAVCGRVYKMGMYDGTIPGHKAKEA